MIANLIAREKQAGDNSENPGQQGWRGDTLGKIGIKRVPTVGSPFDPSQHEAIQQLVTDEHPPGTIVAEVQPGYTMGDRLLRAAMVVVAKPSQKNGEGDKTEPN